MRWLAALIFVFAASSLAISSPPAGANKAGNSDTSVVIGSDLVKPETNSCTGGYCSIPSVPSNAPYMADDIDKDGLPGGVEKPVADKKHKDKKDDGKKKDKKKDKKDKGNKDIEKEDKDNKKKDKDTDKDYKIIPGNQSTCPVTGEKVNKKLYVDHDGYRIYFCCTGCVEAFKKNPGKWLKKLKEDGVKLARIEKKSDEKDDAEKKKDKDKKSDAEGSEKDKAEDELKTQTTCPIMMVDIKKRFYVDYEGKRYYFCCNACVSQFKRNPEKWIKKLKEMGQKPVDIPDDE